MGVHGRASACVALQGTPPQLQGMRGCEASGAARCLLAGTSGAARCLPALACSKLTRIHCRLTAFSLPGGGDAHHPRGPPAEGHLWRRLLLVRPAAWMQLPLLRCC